MQLYQPPPFKQDEWHTDILLHCGNSYGIGVNEAAYQEIQTNDAAIPEVVETLLRLLRLHQNPDGLVGIGNFLAFIRDEDARKSFTLADSAVDVLNLLHGDWDDGEFEDLPRSVGRKLLVVRPRKPEYRHLF